MVENQSHDFLRVLAAPGRYAGLYRGAMRGELKRDRAVLKDAAGNEWAPAEGAASIELPIDTLQYYLRSGFLYADGLDTDGSEVFRITPEGKVAADEIGGIR
jgi:hypothetical protein